MGATPLQKNQGLESLVLEYYHRPSGDLANEIVKSATGLVYHYASRYANTGLWQDLTQAGFEGVLKALKGFDPSKGVLFATYASYYIIGEIYKELQREAKFDKPPGIGKLQAQILSTEDRLRQSLQRDPSLKEISQAMNLEETGIMEAMLAGSISLEEIDIAKIRNIRYESFKLPIEDLLLLKESVSRLSKLQQRVIYLNFYRGFTQSKIASEIGTSQRQVSRLIKGALAELAIYMRG